MEYLELGNRDAKSLVILRLSHNYVMCPMLMLILVLMPILMVLIMCPVFSSAF